MKKTILIQTILVVLSLLLLIFIRLNQPPFQHIPTTIHLSDRGGSSPAEREAPPPPEPEPTPPPASEPEPAPEEVEVAPASEDTNETEYQ